MTVAGADAGSVCSASPQRRAREEGEEWKNRAGILEGRGSRTQDLDTSVCTQPLRTSTWAQRTLKMGTGIKQKSAAANELLTMVYENVPKHSSNACEKEDRIG